MISLESPVNSNLFYSNNTKFSINTSTHSPMNTTKPKAQTPIPAAHQSPTNTPARPIFFSNFLTKADATSLPI